MLGTFLCFPPYFLRHDLSLSLGLTNWVGRWPASPRTSCLHLPSVGAAGECSYTYLFFSLWVLEAGTLVFMPTWQALD